VRGPVFFAHASFLFNRRKRQLALRFFAALRITTTQMYVQHPLLSL
jgi:hypothetical protein